jgi:hypothetical protein
MRPINGRQIGNVGLNIRRRPFMKHDQSTSGFEQYLALGAGLHNIVEAVPDDAYPLRNWDELQKALTSMNECYLIVPGEKPKRPLVGEILRPNLIAIRKILGNQYFPLENQQDFARKAGLVIITLVIRRFGGSSEYQPLHEQAAAEMEAFKKQRAAKGE